MKTSSVDPASACLAVAEWPGNDREAWLRALRTGTGPFRADGGGRRLTPASIRKYQGGYGRWLGWLTYAGDLRPDEAPAERPTLERLDKYFVHLRRCGNADYTVVGRFSELRGALQLMIPGAKFPWITSPHGRSLHNVLPMKRRPLILPGAEVLQAWSEDMYHDALGLRGHNRRCVKVRDAVLLAIWAERGPRLRTVFELRIGKNLQRHEDGWALLLGASNMKMKKPHWFPLSDGVTLMLDRYVAVERQELLAGKSHDALWVNWNGDVLGRRGVEKRARWRTEKRFGHAFGPQRFRTCFATTSAQHGFEAPLDGAVILGHSQQTFIAHYVRSQPFAAGSRHVDRLRRLREATASLARRSLADKRGGADLDAGK